MVEPSEITNAELYQQVLYNSATGAQKSMTLTGKIQVEPLIPARNDGISLFSHRLKPQPLQEPGTSESRWVVTTAWS